MKKFLASVLLLISIATSVQAIQSDIKNITDFTATGSGVAVGEIGSGIFHHRLSWHPTGTVSTCSVKVQQSVNGTSWTDLIAGETCTSSGASAIGTGVANYIRITLVTFSGSGSLRARYDGWVDRSAGGGGGGAPTGPAGGGLSGTYPDPSIVAAGPLNAIQFDSAGTLGGDANLTWVPASGFTVNKHAAFGATAVIDVGNTQPTVLYIEELRTDTSGLAFGLQSYLPINPASNSSAIFFSGLFEVDVQAGNNKNISDLVAQNIVAHHYGTGNITNFSGAQINLFNDVESVGTIAAAYGIYGSIQNDAGKTITNGYGRYNNLDNAGTVGTWYGTYEAILSQTGTLPTAYLFYANAIGGKATNAYSFWSDEQGVFRIRSDNTFNSVYQAIPALYNPQFTKYTPGAANHERGVLGQWESNVFVITTEKGGTGTLREMRIGDAGVDVNFAGNIRPVLLTASLPVFTDGSKNLVSLTANAALNALLPSQGSNSGKFLTTNGTDSSWATISSTPAFSAITAGTNTAALVVGTGGSFTVSGSGTINATSLGGTAAASYALLANPTFTTGITSPVVTITQGTIAADAPQINGMVTWNNSGIVGPVWKMVATDTSSNATALLVDLQIGPSTSIFKVDKTGTLSIANGAKAKNIFLYDTPSTSTNLRGHFDGNGIQLTSAGTIEWNANSPVSGGDDLFLLRGGAATLHIGAADVNGNAVAQTFKIQSGITGTDKNGANWTFIGSKQTGAGTPGDIIFQTSAKLASGTTQGTPETGLTITGAILNMHPSVVVGNAALATTATEGFLYIPTCAGTPTGVPTTRTGRIAMTYDTTNHQFWFYDGAWLQPKTPAGAAIVTWQ